MTTILSFIDHWKQKGFLQIFTIYLRYLIGGAFVMAAFGMGKFNNNELLISAPGTPIQDLEPLQQFFRVMATSGLYWKFIGWSQLIGGLLLMTQRWAKLGAVIFFGIILNIFIITVSFGFVGTPVVTGLMLLATIFLLLWDLDSLQFVIFNPSQRGLYASSPLQIHDQPFWKWIGLFMFFSIAILYFAGYALPTQLIVCFSEGLIAFFVYFLRFRLTAKA